MSTSAATDLAAYADARIAEFGRIDAERRALLDEFAGYIRDRVDAGSPVRLNFICTHNSRRSLLSMIWAAYAAGRFGIDGVETYSGGTESSAFDPRAVAAAERAGATVVRTTTASNPIYHISFGTGAPALTCFSKVYNQAPNPSDGFAAVMVCGRADENCPVVFGADARFAIRYADPKAGDGTPEESVIYDERCAQIAREMLYAFSRVSG